MLVLLISLLQLSTDISEVLGIKRDTRYPIEINTDVTPRLAPGK